MAVARAAERPLAVHWLLATARRASSVLK